MFSPPPSPDIRPFDVPAPAYTDPLQTLAQMGQLRSQALQRQVVGQEMQQRQMQLDSNRAMLDSFAQGGTIDDVYNRAAQSGKVLPGDLMALKQHQVQLQTEYANLGEKERSNLGTDVDRYRGLLSGVQSQADLDAANAKADQYGIGPKVPRFTQFTDPTHVTAFANGLATQSQLLKEATERAGLRQSELTSAGLDRTQAMSELRAAQNQDGSVSPSALSAIAMRHPTVKDLPSGSPESVAQYIRSAVPEAAVPEFDIKSAQAAFAKSLTPATIDQQVDKVLNPDNYSDPNVKQEVRNENATAKTMAAANMALGPEKVAEAIQRSVDRIGRLTASIAQGKATVGTKIEVAAGTAQARADAADLTPDDYARAGEQYARTGVMPAMGRDSVTRGRIVHAANEWAKGEGLSPADMVTMQAAYSGDKESLKNFQKQRDQIVSFEQTAQKNLDLFLNAAAKIPDTGVPWINRPLRDLDANLVGSANMAAVNAARQVANNEIAKVTSGGGMSGVLSDSARSEVANYNPANATFAQTKAVANILKRDMANRHQSMDATISDIKSRIGGQMPAAGTAHVIQIGNKRYRYNGPGDTADLKNYKEITP